MNIIEYALRLGKFLRKTPEGQELLNVQKSLEEQYKGNEDFLPFSQYIENQMSHYYFYAGDVAYKTFSEIINDTDMEHRELFLKTAELVKADEEIKRFADMAVEFGVIFEKIVSIIISGGDVKNAMRPNWKYKIKNAIDDVQIGVERTLFVKEVATFAQTHMEEFKSSEASEYNEKRENAMLLAYSDSAKELMKQYTGISDQYKIVIEDMHLLMDVVKKGIFYGFWDTLNIISEDDLIEFDSLTNTVLQEVTFKHKDFVSALVKKSWLYRIDLKDESFYFLAHKKVWHMDDDNQYSEISGLFYPIQDKEYFKKYT